MRLFALLVFSFCLCACRSPKEEIGGRWRAVRFIERGQEVFFSDQETLEVEFFQDGKIITLENGLNHNKHDSISFEIGKDSIFISRKRLVLDGYLNEKEKYRYSLEGEILKLQSSDLYYTIYLRSTADSSLIKEILKEKIPLLKRNTQKDIRNHMSRMWKPKQSDSSKIKVGVSLTEIDINYSFNNCTYYYRNRLTSDSTIVLIWNYGNLDVNRMEDSSNLDFLDESFAETVYPSEGERFATYTLVNKQTLFVEYHFPEWTKKINLEAKDSIFPSYLYLE